jgi:hypothetical protein
LIAGKLSHFVFDLGLDVFDGGVWFHVEGNGLSRDGFDVELVSIFLSLELYKGSIVQVFYLVLQRYIIPLKLIYLSISILNTPFKYIN